MIVIALAALLGGGAWFLYNRVQEIADLANTLRSDLVSLEEDFPYTAPEDEVVPEARLEVYLQIRQDSINALEDKMGWFVEFTQNPDSLEGQSTFQVAQQFFRLPVNILEVGVVQIRSLRENEMNPDEYTFITYQMLEEVWYWRQNLPADDPLKQTADQYFQPIIQMNENIQQAEQQSPNQNISAGPFDQERFFNKIEERADDNRPNQELMQAHAGEIATASSAVFVDAWTLETGLEPDQLNESIPGGEAISSEMPASATP